MVATTGTISINETTGPSYNNNNDNNNNNVNVSYTQYDPDNEKESTVSKRKVTMLDELDSTNPNSSNNSNNNKITKRKLKFRNYTPIDGTISDTSSNNIDQIQIQQQQQQQQEEQDEIGFSSTIALETAIKQAKSHFSISATIGNTKKRKLNILNTNDNINNTNNTNSIIPKKINWDLKIHIQKKLKKLEKRTQRSIIVLLRQKLQKDASIDTDQQQQQQQRLNSNNNLTGLD